MGSILRGKHGNKPVHPLGEEPLPADSINDSRIGCVELSYPGAGSHPFLPASLAPSSRGARDGRVKSWAKALLSSEQAQVQESAQYPQTFVPEAYSRPNTSKPRHRFSTHSLPISSRRPPPAQDDANARSAQTSNTVAHPSQAPHLVSALPSLMVRPDPRGRPRVAMARGTEHAGLAAVGRTRRWCRGPQDRADRRRDAPCYDRGQRRML